ncbi:GroES-like protein [Penicillium frequentans]|uniref:GroES-like protein n=1 Tax=Penicillium frequentans TaxID=3151616 RepID=A0AAD6D534_9EURO|nr:GroES-like protein [Penicillium glabrum]
MLPLPTTMKAQVLTAYNEPYTLVDMPVPELTSPYDLLIKVEAASYCHTDAVCAAGGFQGHANAPTQWPHIGCHEFAGTVAQAFESNSEMDLVAHDFRIGDRYAVVDLRQVAPLPTSMSAKEAAPLMCAGLTIYAALRNCELQPGQRIAIIGCGGGLGHLGIQFAHRMGLKVVGTDTSKGALDLAQQLVKQSTIVDATKVKAEDLLQEIGKEDTVFERGQMGCDAAIILPESQAAFDYGMCLLKDRGTCVVVSFPRNGFTFSTQDVVFRHVSIIGSLVGSNRLLREMLTFTAKHGIKSTSKSFALSQLNELVEQHHSGVYGKLIVDMSLEDLSP